MVMGWWKSAGTLIALIARVETPTRAHPHMCKQQWHETRRKQWITNRDSTLLLGTPPGVPRLPYLSIVIINKGVIQDVSGRYPTSLLRTVTFPVHQVLESASPSVSSHNTVYRIWWFPIYETRAVEEPGLAGYSGKKNWLDLGNMKHGMNSPVRWRKVKADCHRTNDLGDSERANKFGSKFIRDGPERNVLSWKPHLGTDDVYGRSRPVAIGLDLGARPHLE